jgi:ABC-type multidrug transport system fused ATPase/permease subunit
MRYKNDTRRTSEPPARKGGVADTLKRAGKYLRQPLAQPDTAPPMSSGDLIFLAGFSRPFWKRGFAGLLIALVGSGLNSALPLGGKVLIDFAVMKRTPARAAQLLSSLGLANLIDPVMHLTASIPFVVLAVLLAGAAAGALGIIQRYLMIGFQQEFTFALQSALFDHLLKFPLSFFRKRQTGYLMARVSDDIHALQVLFSESVSHVIARFFYLCFGFAIIFALSVKLALVLAALVPLYALINYFFAERLRNVCIDERESNAGVSKDIQEVLSGVETIKAYTSEEQEAGKVSRGMKAAVDTRRKRMLLSLLSDYAASACRFASTLVIMWLGADEILKGRLTIGDYIAFTAYAISLSGALDGIFMFHLMLQPVFASAGRLMELFRLATEAGENGEKAAALHSATAKGDVTFEKVSFAYETGRPVLRDISFTARPGQIIAITGPSGAGKTTLVNLMLKFCSPQSGAILIDGHDAKELSGKWLREQIAVVTQDAFVFNESIEKNIRYGKPQATRQEVIQAAKMAHIHAEIEGFPDKYDTEIGERGIRVSAGQRQRISIARAFLKDASILIFDEPTSALDPDAEALVKESIRKLAEHKTTFIIAHSLSAIDIADKILVLNEGKIAEKGS